MVEPPELDGPGPAGQIGQSRIGQGQIGQIRVQDALRRGVGYLRPLGVPTPVLDAEVLLAWVLGVRREDLYTHPERLLSGDQLERFAKVLETRGSRVPVAYIRGKKEFMSLEFYVDRRVLIPRPETEVLVEAVVERLNEKLNRNAGWDGHLLYVADIGTGSGAIAVCLARFVPGVHVFATDVSADALAVARINAEKHGVADRVTLLEGDIFSAFSGGGGGGFEGGFDAIVSNPPYISSAEMQTLQDEITYEPAVALDGGGDGLDVCRSILSQAPAYLAEGGFVALEVASNRADQVGEIALRHFEQVEILRDYSGRERVALASKPRKGR